MSLCVRLCVCLCECLCLWLQSACNGECTLTCVCVCVCVRACVCVSACLPACVLACVGLSVIAPTPYKCVYIGLLHTLHVCMFMCLCAYEDYITDKLNRSLSPLSFSPLSLPPSLSLPLSPSLSGGPAMQSSEEAVVSGKCSTATPPLS